MSMFANSYWSKVVLVLAIFTLLPNQDYAAEGSLDLTFGIKGKVTTDFLGSPDNANALTIQTDGKIVVGGSADENVFTTDFALARYNADGSADLTFGNEGKIITYFSSYAAVNALAIQS